jgi:hypothetical protein
MYLDGFPGQQLLDSMRCLLWPREGNRLGILHDQTERVTCRVQEHSEGLTRLILSFSSTDSKDVLFTLIEIINLKVEMHLFRRDAIGPGGGYIVLDSLKAQSRKVIMHQVDGWQIRGVTRPSLYRNAGESE